MYHIESLLSARLFLAPQIIEERIFFLSNLSGHFSLYSMKYGGSVPEPLLPPNIALQNPHLLGGSYSFYVFPKLHKILVMIDHDGDEVYQPMTIPLDGGYPELAFNNFFFGYRCHLVNCDPDSNIVYIIAASLNEPLISSYQADLRSGNLVKIHASPWGASPSAANNAHNKVILIEGYTFGDNVLYLWDKHTGESKLLSGTPIENRVPEQSIALSRFFSPHFTDQDRGLIFGTALFKDDNGLAYLEIDNPGSVKPVEIRGTRHNGRGELVDLTHLYNNRYLLEFNIDGTSWLYECSFDIKKLLMQVIHTICGEHLLSNGVQGAVFYDHKKDRYILSFSSAVSQTQIFTVEGEKRQSIISHTNERILGIPIELLSSGEDSTFNSYDGTRISARLYFPNPNLNYDGSRPLIYYVHGGPQSQERPDFAWFSMPLIQFLTLNGFAVFVPNVRGSIGYGLAYTKQVDRDWGGKDRLDHIFAMQEFLPKDDRLDISRSGVVGRSYGGYMSLMLAGRHPNLWKAAVDMFGPYDLLTFSERIPETWKPYYAIALGDPQKEDDRIFLKERSPCIYLDDLSCPLQVIQGKNDPRVVEQESSDLINNLLKKGKIVEYLLFDNEGHDVLKYENRVRCYNTITDFLKKYLKP
jgi:pimeloyl-ACP methyl ester carboxylesterase